LSATPTMASTQRTPSSPLPSLTSAGADAEGTASPVFCPSSAAAVTAVERCVGNASKRYVAYAASERCSVTVSIRGSGIAFVTVT
jgi:hypothetical protein